MPTYRTDVDRWLSHENREVKVGETFETVFPKGMKLGDNLHLVKKKDVDKDVTPEIDDLT